MARLETFDYQNIAKIQEEINDVLRQVGEAYGINIQLLHITYDDNHFKARIEGQIAPEEEHGGNELNRVKKYEDDYKVYAHKFGLGTEHLHAKFNSNGKTYEVVGLKKSYRKYPIIVRDVVQNKIYKFALDTVKKGLNLI